MTQSTNARMHRAGRSLIIAVSLLTAACSSAPVKQPYPQYTRIEHTTPPAAVHGPRQQVLSTARKMLGTPYRYGGESPSQGFDCSGLVQYSFERAGIDVPRTSRKQLAHSKRVPMSKLRPGDLLFFKIGGKPSHVGIYLGNGEFIHAPSSGKRVSKARLDSPYWEKRLIRAGNYY